jgi:mannose-1-phosphate guanylyltransferase / mannose-6-phosphate isomerase
VTNKGAADTGVIIQPVILSGGAGSRLWPLSRRLKPKQFLPLYSSLTLFQETIKRLQGDLFSASMVVCNDEHRFLVAEQFRDLGVTPQDILLEPVARNTAPAITVAAIRAMEADPSALLLVLPSDHVIEDVERFHDAVRIAAKAAACGSLVTFGIPPNAPETGYGYIRQGEPIANINGCFQIDRFVEKPDLETAQAYLASKEYTWNSGMFVFSAARFLEEMERLQPDITTACRQAVEKGAKDLDFFRLDKEAFSKACAISVDYAVMEQTSSAAVVPVDPKWNDVGAWSALWSMGNKDENGNVTIGDVLTDDVSNSYVHSDKPLLAVVGVEDIVVVATDDAVLVTSRKKAQDVRVVSDWLNKKGRSEHISHTRVYRPWGHYQTTDAGERFLVKQLVVNPGAKLSLQRHHHRAEHWVVVAGTALVTNGDQVLSLGENQSTYIPLGAKHRLENPGDTPLRLIEVQSGEHISEDDIERLEDTYGRT